MKLVKLHIDGFGRLADFDYNFDENYNVIQEMNGWGKSTFAAFIRVMFYGFEGESKRDALAKERVRYRPWAGGLYGGRIEFLDDSGEIYTLYRHFGTQAKDDEFQLLAQNGLESLNYTDNIGQELFHIDATSFMKTIFFNQNDVSSSITNSIQASLGNVFTYEDDINHYDEVDEKLSKRLNALSPTKSSGEIRKLNDEIDQLNKEIFNASNVEVSMNSLNDLMSEQRTLLDAKLAKRKELEAKQKEISLQLDLKAFKKNYEISSAEVQERRNALQMASKHFNEVIPTDEDLDDYVKKAISLREEEKNRETYRLDSYEEGQLDRLKHQFTTTPTNEELEMMKEKVKRYDALREDLSNHSLSEVEIATYNELASKFAEHPLSLSDLSLLQSKWGNAINKKSTLESRRLLLESAKAQSEEKEAKRLKSIKTRKLVFIILGILLLVGGISLYIYGYEIAGLICGVAGAIVDVLAIVLNRVSSASTGGKQVEEIQKQINSDEEEIAECEASVQKLLEVYNLNYQESMVTSYLVDLRNDYEQYQKLDIHMKDESLKEQREQAEVMSQEIESFLKKYFITMHSSYNSMLYELIQDAANYATLQKRKKNFDLANSMARKLDGEISAYLNELRLNKEADVATQFINLKDYQNEYENAKKELVKEENELAKLKQDELFTKLDSYKEPDEDVSLEEISTTLTTLMEEVDSIKETINQYNDQLDNLREVLDERSEHEIKVEELITKRDELMRKYELISKTQKYLEKAKDSFVERYMQPIMDGFRKYYRVISDDVDKFEMNAHFDITYLEQGSLRAKETLSSGYQDLVGICLRLGLVEAMYTNEKPFLILDDPFVNLDDEKIEGAKKVLAEVSKNTQIIYLTCHESFK